MAEITGLLALLKGMAPEVTVVLVALAVGVTLVLNGRKVNLDAITSVNSMQANNMKALLEQNQTLAEDLHKLRMSQASLHERMDKMRQQNTRMYRHVVQLEGLVQHYIDRCGRCPTGPGTPPAKPPIPFTLEET